MAQVVKLKRSSTAGKVPETGDMVAGEMAMNTADGKLFLRDDSDVRPIVTVNNQVTGSINLIGNITASGNISASSYYSEGHNALSVATLGGTTALYVGPDSNIDINLYGDVNNINLSHRFTGNITASGNISASGDLSIDGFPSVSASLAAAAGGGNVSNTGTPLDNQIAIWTNANTIEGRSDFTFDSGQMVIDALTGVVINDGNNDAYFQVKGSSDNNLLQVNPNNNDRIGIGTSTPSEKLTVEGNISASGQFIGANFGLDSTDKLQFSTSTLQFRLGDNSKYTMAPTIFRPTADEGASLGRTAEKWKELVVNHITASGIISASGDLYANNIVLPIGNKIGVEALDEVYINFSTSNFELTSTTGNVIIQGQGGVQIGTPLVNNITEIHGSISASYFGGNHIIGGLSLNIEPSITASGIISASGTSDNFFGGRLVLDNSTYFAGSETSGTSRNILGIDNSNITQVANANIATNIKGTSITASNNTLIQGTLAIDGIADVSASIAAAGGGGGGITEIAVGTGLDITNPTGPTATVNLDLTEVTTNSGTADAILSNDGDGTLTAQPVWEFVNGGKQLMINDGGTVTGPVGFYMDGVNNINDTGSFNGEILTIGTAISTTEGYVYNLSGSWAAAQADSVTTSTGFLGMGVEASTSNTFMIRGYFGIPESYVQGDYTQGAPLYISATNAGKYSFIPPSAGNVSRIIGYVLDRYAIDRTPTYHYKCYFNPSPEWIET